jgi:hypothetical protein
MKKLTLIIALTASITCFSASASESQVDSRFAPALYEALVNAGAFTHGPSAQVQSVLVTSLGCSGGYNQFLRKTEADCQFADGIRIVNVSKEPAINLLEALMNAGLVVRGPAEMSAGSVGQLSCTLTKLESTPRYECTAVD